MSPSTTLGPRFDRSADREKRERKEREREKKEK
jgi:hypothetical protein